MPVKKKAPQGRTHEAIKEFRAHKVSESVATIKLHLLKRLPGGGVGVAKNKRISLQQIAEEIRSEKYRDRSLTPLENKEIVPGFLCNHFGLLGRRRVNQIAVLEEITGVLTYDFDCKNEDYAKRIRDSVIQSPIALFSFLSPSQKSAKVVVYTRPPVCSLDRIRGFNNKALPLEERKLNKDEKRRVEFFLYKRIFEKHILPYMIPEYQEFDKSAGALHHPVWMSYDKNLKSNL